jgi:hypothetical protein
LAYRSIRPSPRRTCCSLPTVTRTTSPMG